MPFWLLGVFRSMDGTERVFLYPDIKPGQSLEVKVSDHSVPVLLQVGSLC